MTAVHQEPDPGVITITGLPGGLPVLFEDPAAEHQIRVLNLSASTRLAVSCTCLRSRGSRSGSIIGSRARWGDGEALAAWRDWHEQRGIAP